MNSTEKDAIVDSNMSSEDILALNPKNPAPSSVGSMIDILDVTYYGFDEKIHKGQIAVNKKVSSDVREFFELALKIKFPIEKVIPISDEKYKWDDELSCNDNNSSGYNYRLIMGTTKMSMHAEGLAFDINPVQNIYVRYDKDIKEIFRMPENVKYDVNAKGTLVSGDPLVTLMKNLGWTWGGDWTPESGREDYQHFEKNL